MKVLELYDAGRTKAPAVLMLHGYSQRKEDLLSDARALVRRGFHVILFDAHLHGDEAVQPLGALGFAEQMKQKMDEGEAMMRVTIGYLKSLIDQAAGNPRIDPDRIGVVGHSMGGCFLYRYLMQPRSQIKIAAAVAVVATPRMAESSKIIFRDRPEMAPFYPEFDRSERLEAELFPALAACEVPLLMVNAVEDHTTPIEKIRACHADLRAGYTDKEKIALREHAGGHRVPDDIAEVTADWFERWMPGPRDECGDAPGG